MEKKQIKNGLDGLKKKAKRTSYFEFQGEENEFGYTHGFVTSFHYEITRGRIEGGLSKERSPQQDSSRQGVCKVFL